MNGGIRFHRGSAPATAGLGRMGDGATGWIAWPSAGSLDAEVPARVRAAITRALLDIGVVTLLVDEPHRTATKLRQGWPRNLLAPPLYRITTREPAAIAALFDDPVQGWWLGSAVALVSDPHAPPPAPDAATWRALAGDRWTAAAARLPAIQGVLRAGVDGEFAGWWSRTDAIRIRFEAALRDQPPIGRG